MKLKSSLGLIILLAPVSANAQEVLAVFNSFAECRHAEASWFNDQWSAEKSTASAGTNKGRSADSNPFDCALVDGRWSLVLR